jgi:ADP-ribose pyrophosphatase YjhB (NUDIX family)
MFLFPVYPIKMGSLLFTGKKMAKVNVEHYCAAVIIVGKQILLLRELGKDDFPLGGFHFPGGRAKSEGELQNALANALFRKYGAKVKFISAFTPLASREGDKKVVLHGFLCESLSSFAFPSVHFQHIYASFSSLSSIYIDALDRKLAEKVAYFYPIYGYKKRLVKLTDKEKGEASFYLDSLLYFRRAIPNKEISDFSLLLRSDSTIEDIRHAYAWLLDTYGLDVNQYLDVIEFKRKKERK